ncbi:transglycosylase domain-containing protein [Phenylobacterium sp. LH3H17]|uniref:transglycosylase domain-containing protein n=1 Tax=Phenylobacterium sp. LH3H17 TaxID=2903901 RepID=UPI0020C9C266|nr:transglycosylase domain-containing protein [Phenylobacterium sp. LH3H17]UTP39112.1 transglycosylase domain-containing protein [Phenylobacterium sp. LH3H17]
MSDPTGSLEFVRAPEVEAPAPAPARPPFWRRRSWQIAGGAFLALLALLIFLAWSLPLGRALEPLKSPTLILVTADGKDFARRGSYKEAPVDVTKLPHHVGAAFVAIEDRRFYKHFGIDLRAIARAVRRNSEAGDVREGASTITQQLAKNAFLTNQRSFRRKAQEALIALYLEARLTKDEILSRYLSAVYFGDGVYGLRAAARHYFDKTPETLSLGESAMLAGMVKAPSKLAPTEDLPAARARARIVLASMVEVGEITPAQARQAHGVRVREGRVKLPVGSYFADWVTPQARRANERAFGEVRVRTTLDSVLQDRAEKLLRRAIERNGWANVTQGAIIAMRPDGQVVVMVGGRDYQQSQFNRAVDAMRQPGSAFKLFVYQAAMRSGQTPDSMILDAPVEIGDWKPENHEGRYAGHDVRLRNAFASSSNVAAVRLAQQVGRVAIIKAARDMGVTAKFPDDLTLALGTAPMSLMELTAGYAAVANGAMPVIPYGVIQAAEPARTPLPKKERDALLDLLRNSVVFGTGNTANISPYAHGKTGTTQDYRDAVFVGFVGDMVVAVWFGNDDNSPMKGVAGGGLPAQVWREFMGEAMRLKTVRVAGKVVGGPPVRVEAPVDLEALPGLEIPGLTAEEGAPPVAPADPAAPAPVEEPAPAEAPPF